MDLSYDWPNSPYFTGDSFASSSSLASQILDWSKYCDPDERLDPEDDAATVNWGRGWRMPTIDEMRQLKDNTLCKIERATVGGYIGFKVTGVMKGYTDKSIFLPGGQSYIRRSYPREEDLGKEGHYWTSSRGVNYDVNHINLAWEADIVNYVDYITVFDYMFYRTEYRCFGLTIRPVK